MFQSTATPSYVPATHARGVPDDGGLLFASGTLGQRTEAAGLTQAGVRLPAIATSLGAMFVLQIGRFAWFLAAREAWRPPGDVSAEQRRNVI